MKIIRLHRQSDGSFINWGRNATINGHRGEGGALWYRGEDAKIMQLVIKYMGGNQS